MAGLRDIVFDCRHPVALARFWADALDGYVVAPYDEAELARLRANGIDDPDDDPTVLVVPVGSPSTGPDEHDTPGARPRLWFQRVPEAKVAKNRVHLDLHPSGGRTRDAEVARLVQLGGRVLEVRRDLTVLADPEGNELCVLG